MPDLDNICFCASLRRSRVPNFSVLVLILLVRIERPNHRAQQSKNGADLKFGRRVGMKVLQIMMAKQKL
jgi:hypothetical protein